MHRPKRLANRVVEQWEQDLLLKVMQRKIKSAKSTISAIQGIRKSPPRAPAVQKARAGLEVYKEWDFSDAEQHRVHAPTSSSRSDEPSETKPEVTVKPKDKEKCSYLTSKGFRITTHKLENGDPISPELDGHEYGLQFPCGMSDDFITLTGNFDANFKDSDDDLLSQIWSSCKRENALFDDTPGLNQRRRDGAGSKTAAAVLYLNPTPASKVVNENGRRLSRNQLSQQKKSVVRDSALVSQVMKKRETGWRE